MQTQSLMGAFKDTAETCDGPADRLREDGYVIVENLISPAQLAQITAELEPHFAATPRCEGDFYGWRTTRLGEVLTKAPSTRALVLDPRIRALVEPVLAPHCDFVQLNLVQAVRIHAGERGQAPHRDEEMWPADKHGLPWLVNVMWALEDFTVENGATRLWRGSHRSALDRFLDEDDAVAAVMPAGSACIFMGSLTHAAGANRSLGNRTGIIVSYCLGWLKTYENQFLTYPPDVARSFAPELQSLIGYRIHKPNLGGWNGQDPGVLLREHAAFLPHVDALPEPIVGELKRYYEGQNA